MRMRSRKRSSCDSGSGKVPSYSCGFCVASTMNGLGSGMGGVVERDLRLVHRLQQARLGLGGGAVDLVGEHDIGEERAGLEDEFPAIRLVHRDAQDVGGQHVRGELDALEAASDGAREGGASVVLPTPGHVLDEEMPAREESR